MTPQRAGIGCLGALIALVAAFGACTARNAVVHCDGALVTVAAPDGWQAWPAIEAPDAHEPGTGGKGRLFGFTFESEPLMGPKYGLGHRGATLRDENLCPRPTVSLAPWFEGQDRPWMRHVGELRMRHDRQTDVHVVSGRRIVGKDVESEEQLVVAFRRDRGARWALRTEGGATLLVVFAGQLVVGAACLGAAIARGRAGHHRRARRAALWGIAALLVSLAAMAAALGYSILTKGLGNVV